MLIRIQRESFRADPDAEIDLLTGWRDDLATADNPRSIRLWAG
jgi:hypothetical protein